MASRRYSLVFYVAVAIALAATYGVYRTLEATKAASKVATRPVVVASRDINDGELIDRLALSVAEWPVVTIPVGAYGMIDSVVDRVARVAIFNGEPIVPGRLAPEGTAAGLASRITPGKRAYGVRINDVSGLSGLIQPDSRVDIVLTTNVSSTERVSKTFMSNMRVLSINSAIERTADGRPIPGTMAAIEVTPEEGEQLAIAQTQGQIQLALRGYGDPDSIDTKGATTRDVQNMLRNAPTRPAPAPRRTSTTARATPPAAVPETVVVQQPPARPARPDTLKVEVFRAGQKSELKFQKDTSKRDSVRRDTLTPPDTLVNR